jgi:two-component system OmpR family sensor kinase
MRIGLPRSLTSRLVVTAVGLVAIASLLLGAATALAMQGYLTDQLDAKVLASVHRVEEGRPPGVVGLPPDPDGDESEYEPGRIGNQEPGTLVAFPDAGIGVVLSDHPDEGDTLPASVVQLLADVPADGEVHQLDLPGFGTYRVAAVSDEDEDRTLVTGLPTADVHDAVTSLVRWEVGLALLGTVAAALAGTVVVGRQLRPLAEVAATAHRVAAQPLDSGEVGELDRVPAHLTDESTEVGQVGAALDTLLDHVQTSLAARHRSEQQVRQFVADASHELRTPLTTIAGYTELARRRRDGATTATALAKVEEEAARMTALVEDLLLLARLDAGRPLARETVDLTRLLVEAVDDARVVAPDHRWRVVIPDDGSPVEVAGDGDRLHQVVTNLLTNARKHTPAGTTVTVTARPDGFDVHDDGPGFPPDLATHAFERFTRGDASRHREGGAGLGLALVDAIVSAHDGSVSLASRPGDTTIRVVLPDASCTS